jgi:O-antigen ligase
MCGVSAPREFLLHTRSFGAVRACHVTACVTLFIQALYFLDVIELLVEPSSSLNRTILFSGFLVALMVAFFKLPVTLRVARFAWLFLPIIVWFWLTAFWAAYPDLVRQRSIAYAVSYASALGLAVGMRSPRGFIMTLYWASCVVILANIISLAFPATSHSEIGIKGIHTHKNVAGFAAIMCGTIVAFTITQLRSAPARLFSIAIVVLALVFLVLTKSKTNYFVLAVLIAMFPIYLLVTRQKPATQRHFIFTCIFCAIAFLIGASGSKLSALGALYGDPTLTNRAVIWVEVEAFIAQSPWRGIGFGSFWDVGGEWNLFPVGYYVFYNDPSIVNVSHNGYLDIMLHGGRIALVLACIATAAVLCYTLALATSDAFHPRLKWIFCLLHCLIIMLLVQNLTESSIFFPSSSGSYFALILMAQAARWRLDIEQPNHQARKRKKRRSAPLGG